jgi:multidrug resistance efflux pump
LKAAHLEISSPISGVVLTRQPQDYVGHYSTEGSEILEVADLSSFLARIYVSEYDMRKIAEGARARLQVEGVPQAQFNRRTTVRSWIEVVRDGLPITALRRRG